MHKIINLPFLYMGVKLGVSHKGKAHRSESAENRVMRIFGPKSDKVAGGRIKLRNEERHHLFFFFSVLQIYLSYSHCL